MQDLVAEYQQYQDATYVFFFFCVRACHLRTMYSVDEEAEYDGGEEPLEEDQ